MRRSFERFLLDKKPSSWQLDLHMLLAQTAGTLTIMVMRIISKNNNTLPCFGCNRLDEFGKVDKVDKVICAALSLINCIQPLIISRTPHPRCKLYRCGPCFVFFSLCSVLLYFVLLCFALFSSTLFCFVQLNFALLCSALFYFACDCRLQRPWRSTALQRLQIQSAFLYFVFIAYFGVLDILEFGIFWSLGYFGVWDILEFVDILNILAIFRLLF